MIKTTLNITNDSGLHARAAGRFVELTNQYSSEIYVAKEHIMIDGKSIMGIISMGIHKGDEIEVTVEGVDEREAMDANRNRLHPQDRRSGHRHLQY